MVKEGEFLHKESFKWWWNNMGGMHPPLFELFNANFSDKEYNNEINLKRNDSIINFKKENLKLVDEDFVARNRNKLYARIAKPLFNESKDWCIFILHVSQPYVYSYERVFIYVKINAIWYKYHSFSKTLY